MSYSKFETALAWFLGLVGTGAFVAFIWGACATLATLSRGL